MAINNQQSILDINKVITGKDGQLFLTLSDKTNMFLGEVDTFQAQLSVTKTEYQPVGSTLSYAVTTGYSVTLTMTEVVIRDDVMMKKLFDEISNGNLPQFDFVGKLSRSDGSESRQVFRNCIPDGSIDLMNLTPGEIIKRTWSFRVNSIPKMEKFFK